ncbi:MAG: OsmC family protein [Alphaproteobacteria bacterium]|nr:OsmC family protein [Alphaproteobacteria bacterium]
MAIVQKTVRTLNQSAVCPSHSRTDVSVRDLVVTLDEPEPRGGTNKGSTPTETLMISLVGCTNVITNRLAERAGLEISDMKIDIQYDFHFRGATLDEDVGTPFDNIVLTIACNATGSKDQFQPIKDDLGKFCPVSRALSANGQGAKITEVWNVTHTG